MTTGENRSLLEGTVGDLEIEAIIGFDGNTIAGFRIHPDGDHVIFPLGNKVSILHWANKRQEFLTGHTNTISAIDVSRTGKYLASGQINHIGFRAWVILWDFKERCVMAKHELHKVRVEAVAFSHTDQFLMSLGGRDCGSLVVWDVEAGQALSGQQASHGIQGNATVLCTTNRRDACFITAGDGNLTLWKIDKHTRSVCSEDVNMSKLKRVILCMDLNERDEIGFCGTSTGDILKIRLNYHHDVDVLGPVKKPIMTACYAKISKKKLPMGTVELYAQGVRALKLLPTGEILVGAGDGTIDMVIEKHVSNPQVAKNVAFKLPSQPELLVLKSTNVKSVVTSMEIFKETTILIGTLACEVFSVDLQDFTTKLIITCHTSTIYSVAFPKDFSAVFATSSKNDVRIWNLKTREELLRIKVPNFSCSCVTFSFDGKSILTAWNDGIIRSFTPLTGRLIYAIMNAHNKGVSAIAVTSSGRTIISGGCEGQVRLWDITPISQKLMCTLKEHKGPVSAVHINHTDDEAVSASTDGTCIIWDVIRQVRKQILFANTLFMCVKYFPTGVQILTVGSDRKISYWEVLDGCLVRELDGSNSGALNSLDISPKGSLFVTGGNDQIVKLWKYQEGVTTHIGLGHSAVVTSVTFSPDGNHIVSTSASGSIFIWRIPDELKNEKDLTLTDYDDEGKAAEKEPSLSGKEFGGGEQLSNAKEESIHEHQSISSKRSDISNRKSITPPCAKPPSKPVSVKSTGSSNRSCGSKSSGTKTNKQLNIICDEGSDTKGEERVCVKVKNCRPVGKCFAKR